MPEGRHHLCLVQMSVPCCGACQSSLASRLPLLPLSCQVAPWLAAAWWWSLVVCTGQHKAGSAWGGGDACGCEQATGCSQAAREPSFVAQGQPAASSGSSAVGLLLGPCPHVLAFTRRVGVGPHLRCSGALPRATGLLLFSLAASACQEAALAWRRCAQPLWKLPEAEPAS